MSDSPSRGSSKHQTVIPKAVRSRLSLKTRDSLRFSVTSEGAVTAEDDPFATFDEWNADQDERLYGRLSFRFQAVRRGRGAVSLQ